MGVWSGSQDVPDPCREARHRPRAHGPSACAAHRAGEPDCWQGTCCSAASGDCAAAGTAARLKTPTVNTPARIDTETRVYIDPYPREAEPKRDCSRVGVLDPQRDGKAELRGGRAVPIERRERAAPAATSAMIISSGNSHRHRHRHTVGIAACRDAWFGDRTIVIAGMCV